MMLHDILKSYAQTIVDNTQAIIGSEVLITDKSGMVIAANDKCRLGTLHSHSISVMLSGKPDIMYAEEAKANGIREGICLPIQIGDEIVGTVGITGNPDQVSKYGHLVQKEAELFVQEKSLQYFSYLKENTISNLIGEILSYDPQKANEATIYSQGLSMGYNFKIKRTAVIVDITNFGKIVGDIKQSQGQHFTNAEFDIQILKASILSTLREVFNNPQDIATNITSDKFLVLACTDGFDPQGSRQIINDKVEVLKKKINDKHMSFVIGVGFSTNSMLEIKAAVDKAWTALRIGKLVHPQESIYYIRDFALEDLLFSISSAEVKQYIDNTLGALLNSPEWTEDLRTTLVEWLKTPFMQGDVAKRLSIHRNSLYYRLERIDKLGSLDIHNHKVILTLEIALLLYDLFKGDLDSPADQNAAVR